jgi:DNA-binding NtrC family response regulator
MSKAVGCPPVIGYFGPCLSTGPPDHCSPLSERHPATLTRTLCLADTPLDAAHLEDLLERLAYPVDVVASVAEAIERLGVGAIDSVLAVCQRPKQLGLELLARTDRPVDIPVIIVAGDSSIDHVIHAMRAGALDYLPKPVHPQKLATALEHAATQARLRAERNALLRAAQDGSGRRLAGRSEQMERVRYLVRLVAGTNATVLIEGESGTGKELVARSVHEQSRRAQGPFVTMNCAAIPETLIESTLFGHERGAFTGATSRAAGAFERAAGGTLFLDEISELRLELQAKLLRVLQEQEFERVGGREVLRANVRAIATSNRDLAAAVADGRFRADLYYRLRVFPIRTPTLRERLEDLPDLLAHHLVGAATALEVPVPPVPEATLRALAAHRWPGNVRELVNAAHRALILAEGAPLRPEHFLLEDAGGLAAPDEPSLSIVPDVDALPLNLAELEQLAIARALARTDGHRANAAKLLGISERTLRSRLNTPGDADDGTRRIWPDHGEELSA